MTDVFDDLAKAFKAGHDAGRSEAADEIERLREALRFYECKEDCKNCYGAMQHEKFCGQTARVALRGEK